MVGKVFDGQQLLTRFHMTSECKIGDEYKLGPGPIWITNERLAPSMIFRIPVAKWVFVLTFAALCLVSLAQGLWIIKKGSDSLSWPVTEGVVGLSRVETRTFRHRVTEPFKRYYPDLLYTYEVQGQRYTGMQIYATPSFILFGYAIGENPGSTQIESVEETLERYPVDQKVTVYYDPDNPAVAVLEPGIPPGTEQHFAWAVVGAVGVLLTLLLTEPEFITRIRRALLGQGA